MIYNGIFYPSSNVDIHDDADHHHRIVSYRMNNDFSPSCYTRRTSPHILPCPTTPPGTDLKNAPETTPYPTSFLDYYTETKMLQEKVYCCLAHAERDD